jgi:cadmium resistance protein CadD (predicted permease)
MDTLLATAGAAAGLYAGTSIDDMAVLVVLNASSRAGGRPGRWPIWAGQYAGTAALVAVSLAAALGLAHVPRHWVGLLGLLPLSLGLGKLVIAIREHRAGRQAPTVAAQGLPGVIGITVANGGDNIAAYTPVFATISSGAIAVTVAVFAAGVAVWCVAGSWLVSHHRVTEVIRSWGHWIIPAAYIVIGLYIFAKTGVLTRGAQRLARYPHSAAAAGCGASRRPAAPVHPAPERRLSQLRPHRIPAMDLRDATLMLLSESADHPSLAKIAQAAYDQLARGETVDYRVLSELLGEASGKGVLQGLGQKYSLTACQAMLMPICREIGRQAPIPPRRRRPGQQDSADPLTASTW